MRQYPSPAVQSLVTSNFPSISNQPYGNGQWTISASTAYNNGTTMEFDGWRAFNNLTDSWASGETYLGGSSGTYGPSGTASSTLANGTTARGEWIQIRLPEAIVLESYSLQGTPIFFATRMPRDFVLLGSNTGTSWNVVDTRTGTTFTTATRSFSTPVAPAYSLYRLSVQSISNPGATTVSSEVVQIMTFFLTATSA